MKLKTRKTGIGLLALLLLILVSMMTACRKAPEKYTITFYDGETVIDEVKSAGKEEIPLPEAPGKTDYDFKGWYLDEGTWKIVFDGKNFLNQALTSDVDVYARYEYVEPVPEEYTISFETNGGTPVEPVRVSVLEEAPETTRDGYNLQGWFEDKELTLPVSFPYSPDRDITLYAAWSGAETVFFLNEDNQITGAENIPETGELIIPATVGGVAVTGIAARAFEDNDEIVSVKAADEIVSFGVYCFRRCTRLQSVKISGNTAVLPEGIFAGCVSLTQVELPGALREIRSDAFSGSGLRSVELPSGVKSVWDYVFKDCAALARVDLARVSSLGDGIFQNCTALTAVTIPDSVSEISGNYMFSGCSSLETVVFPDRPLAVEYTFLEGSKYYSDPAHWENGVLYLNKHLLAVNKDFAATAQYTVREGTICIANHAFSGGGYAKKLQSVSLPEGLVRIGKSAFGYCSALVSANIPGSVEFVGEDAFAWTPVVQSGKTSYLDGWLLSYVLAPGETAVIVAEGTVGIADGRLLDGNYSAVTRVELPSTLRYIGEENFRSFSAVQSISLPAGLRRIGNRAFDSCSSLTELDLSGCKQLQSIGSYAFSFCRKISGFYIAASVVELGTGAFNQIPGVVVDFEIGEDEIPAGWSEDWDFTYASVPVVVHWNVA